MIFTCPGKTCNSQTSKGHNPRNDDPGGAFQTIAEDFNIVAVMRPQLQHIHGNISLPTIFSQTGTQTTKPTLLSTIWGLHQVHLLGGQWNTIIQSYVKIRTDSIVRSALHTLMFKWMTKGPAILVQTTILNTKYHLHLWCTQDPAQTSWLQTQVQMCPAAGDDDGHQAQIVFLIV